MAHAHSDYPVLTAICAGRLIAVPESTVVSIATGLSTPPPPWSLPWVGGLTDIDGQAYVIVSLFGCEPTVHPQRQMNLLLIAGPQPLRVALQIQEVRALTKATPLAGSDRPSPVCPHGWLRACRLADGRDAVLVDSTVIVAAMWAHAA